MKHLAWLVLILLVGCNVASPTLPNGGSGGTTKIAYLIKQASGVVFRETFENNNFINADGWTTVQGVPTNSTAQAKQGIASFQCTGTSSTLSIIQKPLTYTQFQNTNIGTVAVPTMAECWFYDDLTTTSGTGPYFKVQSTTGKFYQIGVRNSISTSYYVCNPAGNTSADQFAVPGSPVKRTLGWHKFQVLTNWDNANANFLTVDGNDMLFTSLPYTSNETFSNVFVCSGTSADKTSSFGYFDSVGVYMNQAIFLNNASGRNGNWYDTNNALLTNALNWDLTFYSTPVGDTFAYPIKARIEISDKVNQNQVEYASPFISFFPGDVYSYQVIDPGRKVTTYDTNVKELQSVNISTAGVRETNNFGIKNDLTFSINKLEGYQWRQSIDNFYLNAAQGNPFSLMVDNVTDNAWGVIGTSSAATANQVTILKSLAAGPTTQFTLNNYYVVRNAANTQRQVVQVTAIGTSTLTFDQGLNFATNPGDYVYSLLYYPFLEVNGNSPTGFKVTDPSIPRYNWTQSCSEFNNG